MKFSIILFLAIAIGSISYAGAYTDTSTNLTEDDLTSVGGNFSSVGSLATINYSGLAPSASNCIKVGPVDTLSLYSETEAGANAATLCDPYFLPWTESFEFVTIPAFPECWKKENGDWVTTNNANSSNDADAHSGVKFLRESYSATNEYIWTPGFYLDNGHLYAFSFWMAGDNYSGWTGDVLYNTLQSSSGATLIGSSFVTAGTVTTKTYTQIQEFFSVPVTGTYYFAIRINATSVPWYLSFDDFRMEVVGPECPLPYSVSASGITSNSAILSWEGLETSFSVEYGPAGFILGTGTRITGITSPYTLTGLEANTAYSFYVGAICFPGPVGTNWGAMPYYFTTLGVPDKTLNVNCFLEGLYYSGDMMLKAQNITGDQFADNTADQIKIELHDPNNYSTISYFINDVNLSISGLCSCIVPGSLNGSYYITVRHRNSIETTTASPVSFSGAAITYDFTLAASQAYGNNMLQMTDGNWAFFGGDINQDGLVNSVDINDLDDLSLIFSTGYIPDDVNGDGLIDEGDMIIVDNNSSNFVSTLHPGN